MAPSDPPLEIGPPLGESELPQAEALVAEAGWNQTADDWRVFREFGTVYAIRNSGRVVATAATLPYGERFAWISMVLVTKTFQRRGIATQLLQRCVDDIVANKRVPVLDATPAGREVYRRMGFEDSWSFQRYNATDVRVSSRAPLSIGTQIHGITDSIWPRLCAYDARAFGADRSGLLASLRRRLPQAALYAERDGEVIGFLLGRDGRISTQLGPLVAEDDETAIALLAQAFKSINTRVFIDIADARRDTVDWLSAISFTSQRPLTRMLYRRAQAFDDGRRTYAVVGPEFG
jgi:GNAT superfamily N-acetyltransferase